jgi:hypothetical protein
LSTTFPAAIYRLLLEPNAHHMFLARLVTSTIDYRIWKDEVYGDFKKPKLMCAAHSTLSALIQTKVNAREKNETLRYGQ